MNSQSLLLLCLGLCAGPTSISGDESLLKPVINVLPSSVVPSRGNVTLVCFSLVKNIICDIQRSSNLDTRIPLTLRKRPPKLHSSWAVPGWFHFHLVGLEESDSGHYVCKCDTDNILLPYSDAILILVTGHLPKPSLQAHPGSYVNAGGKLILQCEKPDNMTEYEMFMLLKEGDSSPVQMLRSERNRADFSLQDITDTDTGNYSCVYHQIGAPFWTSHSSDPLEILVSDPSGGRTDTKENGKRLNHARSELSSHKLSIFPGLPGSRWTRQIQKSFPNPASVRGQTQWHQRIAT
ncbi:T-cell-interacting, activating receptor on myeloid cells protein 1-like isoform X2 [Mesocricetus auratus]|uniref:T-cell-interacting, activating receptor on myeloid cells protein 1-like isoform X2 n=1 Tax=Mesocricetus auratus TaxID=10036 RepID=UPI001AEFEE55|nr:T-cell-interacting, activating receptor on myeloid cells protein 1-like isoform X2 [Mesocricetus auratus]